MSKRKYSEINNFENLDISNYFVEYEVIKKIKNQSSNGSGAFSKVFKVNCEGSNYAFKVTQNKSNKNALNEALILKKLNKAKCPYILNLVRFGYSNILESFILQTNYYEYDLGYIIKKVSISEFNKCHIYECISKGLNYLHSNKIIHCDVKPQNILVSRNLKIVKICDFNISVINNLKSISSNTYKVSRFYRPPELFLKKKFSEKIDIWSFGIIMYEMESRKNFIINNGNIYTYLANIQDLIGEIKFNDSDIKFVKKTLKYDELFTLFSNYKVDSALINTLSENKYFPLIKNCLKYNEKERYSASQVCDFFINLKYKII